MSQAAESHESHYMDKVELWRKEALELLGFDERTAEHLALLRYLDLAAARRLRAAGASLEQIRRILE